MIGERGDAPFGSNNLQFSRHLADNSEDSRESSDVNCNINWYRPLDFSGALRQSATNASLSARPFLSNHGRSSGSDLHTSTHNSSDQKQASKLPNNNLVNIFLDSKRSNMISDSGHELYLRQKAMLQVQILGNKIRLKQFCINTAMVCMHRMFLIHDITRLSSINFVAACLFLAAKIEESPISLEACAQYVISLNAKPQSLMLPTIPDAKSQECRGIMNEIIAAENLILHSLAFDLDIIHPHYMIISFCKKMKLPNQLVKVAYTFGTYILVLSNLCVRYKPSCLACICINLAYKCIKSPLGGKVETQIDAKNSQTLPDNSKKEISDHTLDHLSPPLPSSSPNDDSKTNGEGEIKDEVANKNSDDPSMLTRQNPLNTHNSSIIPMLEDCRWAENYEESLKGDLLKILTNEFLVAIQRTPNELKRTLVRQTFSGNEPEHSQIFDFLLLSNANDLQLSNSTQMEDKDDLSSGSNLIKKDFSLSRTNNDFEKQSVKMSLESDDGIPKSNSQQSSSLFNSDTFDSSLTSMNNDQSSINKQLYLTAGEFESFSQILSQFITSQKDLIRKTSLSLLPNQNASNKSSIDVESTK